MTDRSQRSPVSKTIDANGTQLNSWRWEAIADADSAKTLLFVHATGFHSRCWDQVIQQLPEFNVICVDQRGHGLSAESDPVPWSTFGEDLSALVQTLPEQNLIGIGHSMGGFSLTYALGKAADRFSGICLIDPVIPASTIDSEESGEGEGTGNGQAATMTFRRKNSFESASAMFERFQSKAPYSWWDPEVLRDYCDYGLRENGEDFRLACAPEFEGSIYGGAFQTDLSSTIKSFPRPVTVLRAQRNESGEITSLSDSPTDPQLAALFPDGTDIYLPELSHYIPMQDPTGAATHIRELAERC